MVEIADLRDCAPSGLFYGGRAGQKEGILIEGEPWIAKYPRTTRDLMGKHLPSYTSSPVSEYLGSHIYRAFGHSRARDNAGIPCREDRLCLPRLHVPERAALRVQGDQERPFR